MSVDWKAHAQRMVERLGEDVTIRPAAAASFTVRGIFTAPYREQLADSGVGIASAAPRFAAMKDALPGVIRGDILDRAGTPYRIVTVAPSEPDGLVVLELQR